MFKRTLTAALLSFPLLASAATYTHIDSSKSQIQFHYEQMGVNMDGVFTGFNGDIHFDSADASKAKVQLHVQLNSVDTGSDDADGPPVAWNPQSAVVLLAWTMGVVRRGRAAGVNAPSVDTVASRPAGL